jgi:prophage antirepressor-like protein
MVEAEELGRRLGYERPAKVLDLIRRIFNENEVLTIVGETSSVGGRPGSKMLLNRFQALRVCLRSETEIAERVQGEVTEVFLAAVDCRLSTQAHDVATIVRAVAQELLPVMQTMLQQAQANSETIGPRRARQLKARIRTLSRLSSSWRSKHREISNNLRERCGAPLSGAWDRLPARFWPEFDLELSRIEAEELKRNPPQLTLAVGPAA